MSEERMKIAIEYIEWLQTERDKINHAQLEEIEFFENGVKVDIPQKTVFDFDLTGLSNIDFIQSGYYKKGRLAKENLERNKQ